MKLLKWISLSIAALFTTGCAVDIRPHHRHVRVEYDTWDCPPPRHSIYIEKSYSSHGYHRSHHGGHGDHGYYGKRRRCR